MITIISGTNRKGSNSKKVALQYQKLLAEQNIESKLLALEDEDVTIKNEHFIAIEKEYLLESDKFIFVIPEYNGSYPGILKLLIDNSDVAKAWPNKKALLVGVASGRAGNLRGMEHFTGSLMHMKVNVHYNRLPISSVHNILNEVGEITDAGNLKAIGAQLEEFLKF
jgi:chromate reductase, NAD(P)H dehydrogenase (quinone)